MVPKSADEVEEAADFAVEDRAAAGPVPGTAVRARTAGLLSAQPLRLPSSQLCFSTCCDVALNATLSFR